MGSLQASQGRGTGFAGSQAQRPLGGHPSIPQDDRGAVGERGGPRIAGLKHKLALYLQLIRWNRPAGWLLLLWPTL